MAREQRNNGAVAHGAEGGERGGGASDIRRVAVQRQVIFDVSQYSAYTLRYTFAQVWQT